MSATESALSKIGAGIQTIGEKAALESATARRYGDLFGGEEDPQGELWHHLAHLADLVCQLCCWIIEDDAHPDDDGSIMDEVDPLGQDSGL